MVDDADESPNAEPENSGPPSQLPANAEPTRAGPAGTGAANQERPDTEPAKAESGRTWRPWTVVVAGVLALLASLLLLAADGLAGVLNNLGGAPSAGAWLGVAAGGHGALALASAVLLGAGLASAARRRTAALTAWAIIPVGVGWLFLCGRLAAG